MTPETKLPLSREWRKCQQRLAYIARKRALVLILLAISLLSIVGAVVFLFSFGRSSDAETKAYWPSLTMVYEIDGEVWNGQTARETHRLEYRSASDWTDTVIASDPIESLALGTITLTGSYMRRDGDQVKTYDVVTDDTDIHSSENTVIPNAFLAPLHIFEYENLELSLVKTATTATICYQAACEDNADGLAFDMNGLEWVVLDDERWGIALKVGDKFLVKKLTLNIPKE